MNIEYGDILKDVLSGEYINDLIYGHPERLNELMPMFQELQIDVTPHIVLIIVPDHFWTVCEKKDNTYRYQLKRNILNSTRQVMKKEMKGVAASLIGTDKVVVLLDCENRCDSNAEDYAKSCALKIQAAVQKRTGLSVSIGVSRYCSTANALWQAYEQSFRALESSFQMGDGQILHCVTPMAEAAGELNNSEQAKIKQEMVIAVSTQNKESCVNILNHLTARLALQNASESYTKSLLVITLSDIASYCITLGLNSLEISEEIVRIVNGIFKADTLTEVKKEALAFLYYLQNKTGSADTDMSFFNIAIAYMKQYYMEPLSLQEVAGLCGYSTAYFSRCFKEQSGVNFVQYLMKIRIGNAKKLLKDSELNIAEICEKTGFQSLSYFSTAFKKECGKTPQQYRYEIQKEA